MAARDSVSSNTDPAEKQAVPAQNALPDEVRALAERGILLFPLKCNTKEGQLCASWIKEATCNIEKLETWAMAYPNCNWAARTGPESGFFVVDIDAKHGKDGFLWLQQRMEEHGVGWTEDSIKVKTPNGGGHFWFEYPDFKVVSRDSALASGVDLKGEGGYVLIPPSYVGSSWYHFEDSTAETNVWPAQSWLLDEIRAAQEKVRAGIPLVEEPKTNGHTKYREGERTKALMTYAGKLRNTGMDRKTFEYALVEWDRAHCDPPLGTGEVLRQAQCYDRIENKEKEEPKPESGKIKALSDITDILTRVCVTPEYVIPAINLCRGSICQWVGRDGIGKSWLGLAAAVALSTGGEFLGMPCSKMPVLYLDYQNPDHEVQKRARLLLGSSGPLENLHVWGNWCEQEPARTGSPTLLDMAIKDKPVIIIDPFVHFHNGKNENHPDDMVPVMVYMRKLVTLGATILFFHHSPLVDEERGRGTLAIRAECELALVHTKKAGLHNLQIIKNRFGAPKTIEVDAAFEEGRFTAKASAPVVGIRSVQETIQDFLRKNPGQTTQEIAEGLKIRKATVVDVIRKGMETGMFIGDENKAKGATYYRAAVPDLDTIGSKNGNTTKQSTSQNPGTASGTAEIDNSFEKVSPQGKSEECSDNLAKDERPDTTV